MDVWQAEIAERMSSEFQGEITQDVLNQFVGSDELELAGDSSPIRQPG